MLNNINKFVNAKNKINLQLTLNNRNKFVGNATQMNLQLTLDSTK